MEREHISPNANVFVEHPPPSTRESNILNMGHHRTTEQIQRRRHQQRESEQLRLQNMLPNERLARLERRRITQRQRRLLRREEIEINHFQSRQQEIWTRRTTDQQSSQNLENYGSNTLHTELRFSRFNPAYEHGESSGTTNDVGYEPDEFQGPLNAQNQSNDYDSNTLPTELRFSRFNPAYEHGESSGATNGVGYGNVEFRGSINAQFQSNGVSNRASSMDSNDNFERQIPNPEQFRAPENFERQIPIYDVNLTMRAQYISRRRGSYNCARNFYEYYGVQKLYLQESSMCPYCHALLFSHETSSMCCNNGAISLAQISAPPEMVELFSDQTPMGRHFRKHIRSYNHVFSFTSMGVHVDETLAFGGQGPYTFRAQGAIYHQIGNFLPNSNERPRYMQLYIYDTDHETENRLQENGALHDELIDKIKRILDIYNPFIHTFRHMAERVDISDCRLQIKEQSPARRQYDLPIASEVAAILVGAEEAGNLMRRDIIVQSHGGRRHNVPDIAGFYDPLQYPLLLSYGTYGWNPNCRTSGGDKVTCCDFYSYMFQIRHDDQSVLLRGGRLLHQYAVDNCVKIESNKLRWVRNNQNDIRADFYQGLIDALHAGENCGGTLGDP